MLDLDFINLKSHQTWNQTRKSLKSSRGRHIKRTVYEDNEGDDLSPKKAFVKAPPVISFLDSDNESKMDQVCSKTKSQTCSIKKSVQKTSKKVSNCSHALKKDKLFKKISRVKKQVLRAELMSAPELKQSKLINSLDYI